MKSKYQALKFRLAVGFWQSDLRALWVKLMEDSDDGEHKFTLKSGAALTLVNTAVIAENGDMIRIKADYADGSNIAIYTATVLSRWRMVLLANAYKATLKPGDWQVTLKFLIKEYVKCSTKKKPTQINLHQAMKYGKD